MKPIAVLVFACLLVSPLFVAAQPVIVDSDWTLVRSIPFENPIAAHFNPVDGRIYVGCRETAVEGLYRIDNLDFAVLIAEVPYLAGVVVDPQSGDIFCDNSYSGVIYRSLIGEDGRQTWVSGFHDGDDDPMGMAVAPLGYTGDVLSPGEALVVDAGYGGPDEVWLWSPAVADDEVLLHADDGTLIDPVDITIGPAAVHLVDTGETAPGAIYEVGAGGALTLLTTSEPLADPSGVACDPISGDLMVLDEGDDRVVSVDPASGTVNVIATGIAAYRGWGGVDVSDDGRRLLVSAYDDDMIYVFARCDASADPLADCDGNGVYDYCDIAAGEPDCNGNGLPDQCDIESGFSDDCDLDGVPDDCPQCPPVEVVFIMDTSTSMDDEAVALCGGMNQVVAHLDAAGLVVESRLLGICDLPGAPYGCLENHVSGMLGVAVPGSPPAGLETLGACPGGNEVCQEDWALATAVVAGRYPWQPAGESVRLIIPLADEGPWCGDPVTETDAAAVDYAIEVARATGVSVSTITGSGSLSATMSLAQELADSTGGIHFNSSTPALDIAESIVDMVLAACIAFTDCNDNGILDSCDIESGYSQDVDQDGVPDECAVATAVGFVPPRPDALLLAQNSPNPFNPSTTVSFVLPLEGGVDLAVFAPDGRRVATIAAGRFTAGSHSVQWSGRDDQGRALASGVYICRLSAAGVVRSRTMVLLK